MADERTPKSSSRLIASRRHTVILTTILLVIAAIGFLQSQRGAGAGGATPSGWPIYLSLLAGESALFYYVFIGLRRGGTTLSDIVSRRGWSFGAIVTDIVLGFALVAVWIAIEFVWSRVIGSPESAAVQSLQVHDPSYVGIWIALSITAGFVEELTFRGYFQQQLGALMRSPALGCAAQAILFGVTHGYQGANSVLRIAVFGLLFGIAAWLTKSLRPGMVAHALVDIIGGLRLLG